METAEIGSTPSDEEMRKVLKPTATEQDVVKVLQTSYAKADDHSSIKIVRQLDSYDDCNFLVEIAGTSYLLKIHNGVESRDYLQTVQAADGDYHKAGHQGSVIHLQTAVMQVLTSQGIQTSAPILPIDSKIPLTVHNLSVSSAEHSPTDLVVRLFFWVPGRPMADMKLLPLECLADAGRLLGKIDKSLDLLTPHKLRQDQQQQHDELNLDESLLTAARRFHQWDGKNTAELRSFTHCVTDDKRRRLVESVIDAFSSTLLETGVAKEFRKGINHGDFNDANVLLDGDFQVTGVIDFGDSVESWRVLDVSIAMAYSMLSTYGKSNRSLSAAAAVLRGYNAVYQLTELERKHLVLLISCRLACSTTLGAYSFQQNSANTYLLLHAEPAWKALELLWCYDPDERARMALATNRLFDQACLYNDARAAIVTCSDLVLPDPGVADLLHSVRIASIDRIEPPKKKQKQNKEGLAIVTFVTGNANKLEEVQRILGTNLEISTEMPYHLTNIKVDLPELQGDPVMIAKEKCKLAAEKVQGAVITEDTSLCFNALNGLPGPYIKFFLEKCGHEGLNKMLEGYTDKTGYAQTIVAFSTGPGKEPAIFDGRTAGAIVLPRGKLDFGWDPIFQPIEGGDKTYAEMSKEEKDAISHRSRAFGQLREYLVAEQNTIQAEINKH